MKIKSENEFSIETSISNISSAIKVEQDIWILNTLRNVFGNLSEDSFNNFSRQEIFKMLEKNRISITEKLSDNSMKIFKRENRNNHFVTVDISDFYVVKKIKKEDADGIFFEIIIKIVNY